MTPLYALMHRWAVAPFAWGQSDCALCAADWVGDCHGIDIAAQFRGRYFDAASCERVTGWFSDPVAAMTSAFEPLGGLAQVDTPQPGDVGILPLPSDTRILPVAGVFLGSCWGVKGPSGATTIGPRLARPVAIFEVGHA